MVRHFEHARRNRVLVCIKNCKPSLTSAVAVLKIRTEQDALVSGFNPQGN